MYKVSVVVPVYNAELYIERCLQSLMKQTLDKVQLIIIDDGSTDRSLEIIKKVIQSNSSLKDAITLITRANQGVAYTRNQGLELAVGDYLTYVDSDDWVEKDFLEQMYIKGLDEGADIVICDYYLEYSNKTTQVNHSFTGSPDDLIKGMLAGSINGFTWNKLIKNNIYSDKRVCFESNIDYLEDMIYVTKAALLSQHVVVLGNPLVHYNQTNQLSLTKVITNESINSMVRALERIEYLIIEYEKKKEFMDSLNFQKVKRKLFLLASIDKIDGRSLDQMRLLSYSGFYVFNRKLSLNQKFLLFLSYLPVPIINCFLFLFKLRKKK